MANSWLKAIPRPVRRNCHQHDAVFRLLAGALHARGPALVGPARQRAAEWRGIDHVRDFVRQHRIEHPLRRALNGHLASRRPRRGRRRTWSRRRRPDAVQPGRSSGRAAPSWASPGPATRWPDRGGIARLSGRFARASRGPPFRQCNWCSESQRPSTTSNRTASAAVRSRLRVHASLVSSYERREVGLIPGAYVIASRGEQTMSQLRANPSAPAPLDPNACPAYSCNSLSRRRMAAAGGQVCNFCRLNVASTSITTNTSFLGTVPIFAPAKMGLSPLRRHAGITSSQHPSGRSPRHRKLRVKHGFNLGEKNRAIFSTIVGEKCGRARE